MGKGKHFEPHLIFDNTLIHIFKYDSKNYGIIVNEESCNGNYFQLVLFDCNPEETDVRGIISSPRHVKYPVYFVQDHVYNPSVLDDNLCCVLNENLNKELQDGRTVLETIYDIYIKEIENRNQESLPINDLRLLRHYSRCKQCYLESIGRRKEEDKMENPTIYNSMEEYHRACYNPLKDTEICIFEHNDTKYCIVINYDDCLNRRVQIGKFIEDYDPMGLKGKNYDTIQYAYLTSGYVLFADPAKGSLVDSCLNALYSESNNGTTVLEEIYDTYINCLNIESDKIEDQQRLALRQSYIIDKETHKRVMVERKESKIEQDSSSTINLSTELFDIIHKDKYFFIESPDVRNYLSSINHEFNRVERLYLIYNSTNLGYVEIMDALASDLSKGGYEEEGLGWVKEQVISRVRYMESVINMFNTAEEGTIYSTEFLAHRIINGPMFTNLGSACLYCMKNNLNKLNFRITKKRINETSTINDNDSCGVGIYNPEGILLYCTIPGFDITYKKDENRFEKDITVNIPHPFIFGDIVTDGKTVYYVKSPTSITYTWNNINNRNKTGNNYDGKNNDFGIDCYCLSDEDGADSNDIVVLHRDIRKLVYVPEAKDYNKRIATILRLFDKKKIDGCGGYEVG